VSGFAPTGTHPRSHASVKFACGRCGCGTQALARPFLINGEQVAQCEGCADCLGGVMESTDPTFMELIMARIGAYRVGLIGFVFGLVTSAAAAMTTERSWVLEKGQGVTTLKNSPASLTLNNKQLSGSTGCNTFRATLSERAESRVAINDVAVTRKLCAPPASDNERAIVEAFNKTEFIEERADRLTFLSGSREPLLVWRPAKKAVGRRRVLWLMARRTRLGSFSG